MAILDELTNVVQPAPGSNQAVGQTVMNPHTAMPKLEEAVGTVVNRAELADQVIQAESAAVMDRNLQAHELNTALVEKRANTLEELKSTIQSSTSKVAPLVQQRAAIADRKRELATMNPLVRGIRSIFDASYDSKHLNRMDAIIADQIRAESGVLDYTLQTAQQILELDTALAGGRMAVLDSENALSNQRITLAAMGINSAKEVVGAIDSGIKAGVGAIQAQNILRADTLTGMNDAQLRAAYNQAGKNGGRVVVNGAELTEQHIKEELQNRERQTLSLESARLALANGKMALAEAHQRQLISTMSRAQIEKALRDGGMFQGQQLPIDALGQQLEMRMRTDEARATSDAQMSQLNVLSNGIRLWAQNTQLFRDRFQQLVGAMPESMVREIRQDTVMLQNMTADFNKAKETGLVREVGQRYMPIMRDMLSRQQKAIEQFAKEQSGGDKDIQAVYTSFMNGDPLNSEVAARGMIKMIRNGTQMGNRLSGPAKAAFEQVAAMVAEYDREILNPAGIGQANQTTNSGTAAARFGWNFENKTTKEQRQIKDQQFVRKVMQKVGEVYTNQVYNTMTQKAPDMAKHVQVDGNPHPVANWPKNWIPDAYGAAQAVVRNRNYTDDAQGAAQRSADLTAETLNMLDVIGGPGTSDQYIDLMNNPEYHRLAQNYSVTVGQSSLPDFLLSNSNRIELSSRVADFGQTLTTIQSYRKSEALTKAAVDAQRFNNQPSKRIEVIAAGIPGISREQAKLLATAVMTQSDIAPTLQQQANQMLADRLYGANAIGMNRTIDNFILNGAFKDPGLEKIRQIAAKHWEDVTKRTEAQLDAYRSGGN